MPRLCRPDLEALLDHLDAVLFVARENPGSQDTIAGCIRFLAAKAAIEVEMRAAEPPGARPRERWSRT